MPEGPSSLAAARAAVDAGARVIGVVVPATGPGRLAATRLSETIRLKLGATSMLVVPELDEDWAATALLSGRADLVAVGARRD